MGRKPLGPWVVADADGSAGGLAAVNMAAAEASMRGLRLRVVAACPVLDCGGAQGPGALAAQVEANRAVAEAAARAHVACPDLTVRTLVVAGDPIEALIRESHTAGMLVVGCGPRPGPVWARVAANAHCPTMVVPSNVDTSIGRLDGPVMVGVEAAGRDDAAIGFAFEEAAARGVLLRVMHMPPGWPGPSIGCVDPFMYEQRTARVTADRRLAEALSGWAEKYPQVRLERVSLHDMNVSQALVRASQQGGLVVVGGQALVLGAVTRASIERASCPVCVVSHSGAGSDPGPSVHEGQLWRAGDRAGGTARVAARTVSAASTTRTEQPGRSATAAGSAPRAGRCGRSPSADRPAGGHSR